jgi:hypothetical protein
MMIISTLMLMFIIILTVVVVVCQVDDAAEVQQGVGHLPDHTRQALPPTPPQLPWFLCCHHHPIIIKGRAGCWSWHDPPFPTDVIQTDNPIFTTGR